MADEMLSLLNAFIEKSNVDDRNLSSEVKLLEEPGLVGTDLKLWLTREQK